MTLPPGGGGASDSGTSPPNWGSSIFGREAPKIYLLIIKLPPKLTPTEVSSPNPVAGYPLLWGTPLPRFFLYKSLTKWLRAQVPGLFLEALRRLRRRYESAAGAGDAAALAGRVLRFLPLEGEVVGWFRCAPPRPCWRVGDPRLTLPRGHLVGFPSRWRGFPGQFDEFNTHPMSRMFMSRMFAQSAEPN